MTDKLRAAAQAALEALVIAEAGLADIGDADREPGDDLAWCEQRASEALDAPRKAINELRAALTEPEAEPVLRWSEDDGTVTSLYASPPRREWVGLTDEEIEAIWDGALTPYRMQQLREIENKLKEKNT